MRVWKLEPRAHFHLGEKEAILEQTADYIHSDTLFSAICNAYRLLYGEEELKNMLELFSGWNPPFLISSAFAYVDKIFTLPLPLSIDWDKYVDREVVERLNADREEKEKKEKFDILKTLKKVKFVSEQIFRCVMKEERGIEDYINDKNIIQGILFDSEEVAALRKRFDVRENKDIKIWSKQEVPRVVIDRKTSSSNIYHFGEVSFARNCGLYFLMDLRQKEYKRKVEAAIRVLGDGGIGGDRTYGKGLFKVEFEKMELDMEPKSHFVTLSLYYPREEEVSTVMEGYYELMKRGGWIYSVDAKGMRRRTVRMLAEGSVVKSADKDLYGALANVKPGGIDLHEVYRYGFAFAVPVEVCE
ncbi:MAG: type III-A CRISPR-associated RAMP protein Csm4 [Methanophagales archaeon]|nr:type III-A CRISPR-associated RAMP protein Csm4 [Methanophagales archaeon]